MKNVTEVNFIAQGTFGEAYTVKLDGDTPLLVKKVCRLVNNVGSLIMEILCLLFFNSKYIPEIVYSGYDIDGKWCVLMQYFNGGTLQSHIYGEIYLKTEEKKQRINTEQKKYIAYHLALALEYLHGRNCTHG